MNLDEAMYTFGTGENFHLQNYLGVHELEGEEGFIFRVWAPHAEQIQVIGDFTGWFDEPLDMTKNHIGVWEATSALPEEGQLYKFLVKRKGGQVVEKMDPFATYLEPRPGTGAVIRKKKTKKWKDGLWMGRRKRFGFQKRPVNIYEAHASSWKLKEDGQPYTFKELKEELIPYLVEMNYTHVEFMPLMAHPLGMSWGYQLMGYFAFEHTYGTPEEFQDFVEACHQNNIGVLVDWVPGHYTQNDDALAYFDGTPTFEYQDHDRAHNYRWGALNFDLGKNQVQSFLISSALYWIENYHIDGIRVDAVSNMLYLDYDEGPWMPNKDGGNRNLEGYGFLQKLNREIKKRYPDVMMVAEESTAWPLVTAPPENDGLGFNYKWNMGWMNDTLRYMGMDPYFRKDNHSLLTFMMMYAYSENYILPLSHDEVVHGKGSMLNKMFGEYDEKFAAYRTLLGYYMTMPGKKMLFMGGEFGQMLEWRYDDQLEWNVLEIDKHKRLHQYVKDLNHFYMENKALWELDTSWDGFRWVNEADSENSVLSYIRRGRHAADNVVVVANFTPVERPIYKIGVPLAGEYEVVFHSSAVKYGGNKRITKKVYKTKNMQFSDMMYTIEVAIDGNSVMFLKKKPADKAAASKKKTTTSKTAKKTTDKTESATAKKAAVKKTTATKTAAKKTSTRTNKSAK